jgi:putative phosphoribosyl transferase
MIFASRQDAGLQLGRYLLRGGLEVDHVLGLPRGGVVVAVEVAKLLHCIPGALIVRKIGHPRAREFAVGALAEEGVLILDGEIAGSLVEEELRGVIEEETRRLKEYEVRFHSLPRPNYAGQTILLVDDGLATGATMEAAAVSARRQGARRVVAAAPVSSPAALRRVQRVADRVEVLMVDPDFRAVGAYYALFDQTTDLEVVALLGL